MKDKILKKLKKLIQQDGYYNTYINEVKLYKMSKYTTLYNTVFENWILFTFQGRKKMSLNNTLLEYTPKNYLVASATLPIECETFASKEEPFYGIVISFDLSIILELLDVMTIQKPKKIDTEIKGTFADIITNEIEDILYRILCIVDKEEESKVLGKTLVRELLYRVLKGENSYYLHQLLDKNTNEAKITRAIKTIHQNISKPLMVEELARTENMSVSSFHNHFKKTTSFTPHQYLKKVRLGKAKVYISQNGLNINEVAIKVGYDNASQFSKEFKKYFGFSPKEVKPSFNEFKLKDI